MNNEIDVGQFSEALNNKTDRDLRNVDTTSGADTVIEYQVPTAANNYTWYRKYKSGWVEQGGLAFGTGSTTATSITLPVVMENNNYNVSTAPFEGATTSLCPVQAKPLETKTATTLYILCVYIDASALYAWGGQFSWRVEGMAAN